jgi:hypothetical protein
MPSGFYTDGIFRHIHGKILPIIDICCTDEVKSVYPADACFIDKWYACKAY